MTERIYTEAELLAEKPKGELLLRNDKGELWRVFQCWGCQSCWEYIEHPSGDMEKDTVEQGYPHFLSMWRAEPYPGPVPWNCGECDPDFPCYGQLCHCIRYVPC